MPEAPQITLTPCSGKFSWACSAKPGCCSCRGEMFTATKDGAKLPAAVGDKDYCSAECNGFDSYVQTENNFNTRRPFYFIPKTAKVCAAARVAT